MGRAYTVLFSLAAMLAICALGGCGSGEAPRYAVNGKVLVKGESVPGLIDFRPMDGQKTAASLPLQPDGTYNLPGSTGLNAGKYTVAITAYEPASGQEAPGVPVAKKPSKPLPVIPPEYGWKSKQVVEIKAGSNTFDFIIK